MNPIPFCQHARVGRTLRRAGCIRRNTRCHKSPRLRLPCAAPRSVDGSNVSNAERPLSPALADPRSFSLDANRQTERDVIKATIRWDPSAGSANGPGRRGQGRPRDSSPRSLPAHSRIAPSDHGTNGDWKPRPGRVHRGGSGEMHVTPGPTHLTGRSAKCSRARGIGANFEPMRFVDVRQHCPGARQAPNLRLTWRQSRFPP